MALQEGTYTWEYNDTTQALGFTVAYNTLLNTWTVNMLNGSMDLNALWWSNGNTTEDGVIRLSGKDNSLNMNGTGVVWDGYDKISDTGLTGKEHNGSSVLTAGSTYTYNYSKDQGAELEDLLAGGVLTLGVRATSVNGSSSIKSVNTGFDSFTPFCKTVISDAAPASWAVQGRARNGSTGFEAVLFTPANPSPTGIPLNPAGTPAWQFGQDHKFQFDYTFSDGKAIWSIDFNRDGDFNDPQESATSVSPTLAGQSFKYAGIFLQGSSSSSATLKDFVINGEEFGPYTAGDTALAQQFEDSCGLFGDITATGSINFSASGGSDERPRFWFRLGQAQPVPTQLTPFSGLEISGTNPVTLGTNELPLA